MFQIQMLQIQNDSFYYSDYMNTNMNIHFDYLYFAPSRSRLIGDSTTQPPASLLTHFGVLWARLFPILGVGISPLRCKRAGLDGTFPNLLN